MLPLEALADKIHLYTVSMQPEKSRAIFEALDDYGRSLVNDNNGTMTFEEQFKIQDKALKKLMNLIYVKE